MRDNPCSPTIVSITHKVQKNFYNQFQYYFPLNALHRPYSESSETFKSIREYSSSGLLHRSLSWNQLARCFLFVFAATAPADSSQPETIVSVRLCVGNGSDSIKQESTVKTLNRKSTTQRGTKVARPGSAAGTGKKQCLSIFRIWPVKLICSTPPAPTSATHRMRQEVFHPKLLLLALALVIVPFAPHESLRKSAEH